MQIQLNKIASLYEQTYGIGVKLPDKIIESIDAVQQFSDSKIKLNYNLGYLLAHLPYETIAKELGNDAVVFAWTNYPYDDDGKRNDLREKVCLLTSFDSHLLEKSRLASWNIFFNRDSKIVFKTYDFISGLSNEVKKVIDLKDFLLANAKDKITLSEKRISDYKLELTQTIGLRSTGWVDGWGRRLVNNNCYSIYMDGPIGIMLMYKGIPNALISFIPKDPETMMITQIQGIEGSKLEHEIETEIKAHSRGLIVLDWEKLLISIVESLSKDLGYRSLSIRSANNNTWIKGGMRIPEERGLQRYDGNAKRLGYTSLEDGNWYKLI